ncbi:TPA: ABC transporter permease, partial [Clostridioides difficile]|nr:ABC transporter permease [Clostridioides difficile]
MKNLEIIDKVKDSIYPIATFLFILILWQSMVGVLEVPQYILPTPVDIINVFFKDYQNLSM